MKKKSRLLCIIAMLVLVFALPATAHAAKLQVSISGATKPTSIKKGASFIVKGKVTAKTKLKEVRVLVYNPTTKKYPIGYRIKNVNAKTCDISQADPYLVFGNLSVGTYYYRVYCMGTNGANKRVVNKKFTVTGTGSIKITNPRPSINISISKGSSYALGGTIKSTYKLKSVKALLTKSGKTVLSATVKPNTKTYNLKNSALDMKMTFNKLAAGTYTLKITATDIQGKAVTLIKRTIKVKSKTSTTPGSTGGNTTTEGDYLNTDGTVKVPTGFVKRTARPAASNKYYYSSTYNIYYKYDSLAPTGKMNGGGYVLGNCTWYACGRAMEIVAKAGGSVSKVKAIFGGDPVGIYNMNVQKKYFKYGKTPKIGALAVFNYGADGNAHIAVVENIVNGVPYVSESGFTFGSTKPNKAKSNIIFKYQSIYAWAGGRSLRGYIYLV